MHTRQRQVSRRGVAGRVREKPGRGDTATAGEARRASCRCPLRGTQRARGAPRRRARTLLRRWKTRTAATASFTAALWRAGAPASVHPGRRKPAGRVPAARRGASAHRVLLAVLVQLLQLGGRRAGGSLGRRRGRSLAGFRRSHIASARVQPAARRHRAPLLSHARGDANASGAARETGTGMPRHFHISRASFRDSTALRRSCAPSACAASVMTTP